MQAETIRMLFICVSQHANPRSTLTDHLNMPDYQSAPDGVCNLVRYGNCYGTHSVTIPCNYYVSFDMGKIGCVTRSVTRMCSVRGQNARFFCVTVSVTVTVTTTHMQHTAASRCVFVVGARQANT